MTSLEDMEHTIRRNDLAIIIGKELDAMAKAGRFEELYRAIWKDDRTMLAIKLIDKMHEKGYTIQDKKGKKI